MVVYLHHDIFLSISAFYVAPLYELLFPDKNQSDRSRLAVPGGISEVLTSKVRRLD